MIMTIQFWLFVRRCGIVVTITNLFIMGWWVCMGGLAARTGDGTQIGGLPFDFNLFWATIQLGLIISVPFALVGLFLVAVPSFLNRKRGKHSG